MAQVLCLLHTVVSVIPTFEALARELLPNVELVNIVDEWILRSVKSVGHITPEATWRICQWAVAAERSGADVFQLTCSSVSPCVDVAQQVVSIPVLKVDEPMIKKAISLGRRIGVAATAATTLNPTMDQVKTYAEQAGKKVEVRSVLCEEAFEAILSGDAERHDQIVLQALYDLMKETDVILLAQASMARVLEKMPEEERLVPMLTSPRLAMERVARVLKEVGE